jgi:NAD(P)-dependent dehydrogenase (short-subunit alcohol dehydrogenase family)
MNLFSLNGKVALVTGARRGIGRAIALAMSEAGADLAICDKIVEDGELYSLADELTQNGKQCIATKADVTIKSEVNDLVKITVERYGNIDILVNNVGGGISTSLLDTSEAEWQSQIDLNLKSAFLCSQSVARVMIKSKSGQIINLASCVGIRGFGDQNTYNIAKAGVIMLTKVLARSLGKYNIRVNAIAPSTTDTPATKTFFDNLDLRLKEAGRIPLGRLGETKDIIGPAIFLASDASKYITGHTLVIDGGQLA